MTKRIITSSMMSLFALALIVGGTGAFFTDTETSTGNVFTAGNIDLFINHTAQTYNDELCTLECEVDTSVGNLLTNGSFEEPNIQTAFGQSQWTLITDDSLVPGWDLVAGSGIEIQRNAFQSSNGQQHVELDGDGSNSATTIAQTFSTTPGQRYRLTFDTSPRPQSQSAGSGVDVLVVQATSPSGTLLNTPINIPTGQGPIVWTESTLDFIALDGTTTLTFSLSGPANTFGGLLDNVVVVPVNCEQGEFTETEGGVCELWSSTNLSNEQFFNFADIKPQDDGTNLISMTVESNESYLCLAFNNIDEVDADGVSGEGSMGEFMQVAGWAANGAGTAGDLLFGPTVFNDVSPMTYVDSNTSTGPVTPGETQYMLFAWCYGDMTLGSTPGEYTCNGNVTNINDTQGEQLITDLQFFAIQSRNNGNFTCADAVFDN